MKKAYDLLLKAAPDTAKNYAYLDSNATGSGRASASDKEVSTWSE